MHAKLLCVLLMCTPAGVLAQDGSDPFVGAWEVVYGEYGPASARVRIDEPKRPVQLKVFGGGRFAYVRHSVDGSFQAASAGSYAVAGKRYTETTTWSSAPAAIGTVVSFEFRLAGDAVCMSGPVEVVGPDGTRVEVSNPMKEVMRRAGTRVSGPGACAPAPEPTTPADSRQLIRGRAVDKDGRPVVGALVDPIGSRIDGPDSTAGSPARQGGVS